MDRVQKICCTKLFIKTRDKNGNLIDVATLYSEFLMALAKKKDYQAKAYADTVGTDQTTLLAGISNPSQLSGYENEYRKNCWYNGF